MRRELEVLVLEDDGKDEAFIAEQLQKVGPPVHTHRVETREELLEELKHHTPDLAILDHGRPGLTASEALSLVKQQKPEVPCIAIVPNSGDEVDLAQCGAADVIPKERLSQLGAAIERVLMDHEPRPDSFDIASHSKEQLRRFIEAAHDYAIYMLDREGRVASWNSGAQRLEGYDGDEILGQPWSTFFPVEAIAAGRPEAELEKARDEGHAQGESWCRRKDGSQFWCQWSLNAVRDASGELVGFLKIAHDVTEERRAQKQLENLNRELSKRVRERTNELEALNKELEAFTYSVAHDLRAPLRHINAFAEHLKDHSGGRLDREDRDYLEVISRSARTLSEMVASLLNLSRLGRKPLEKVRVNLTRLVGEIVEELKPDVGSQVVKWHVHSLPEVDADPTLLRQVFLNLIGNALKYTRQRDPARIEIGCSPRERDYVIYVRDNGVGFDMALAGKLFGVFQRLHRGEDFEGSGVGLAIVRRIIQKHGGHTWAEGEPDKGATFYVSLPK